MVVQVKSPPKEKVFVTELEEPEPEVEEVKSPPPAPEEKELTEAEQIAQELNDFRAAAANRVYIDDPYAEPPQPIVTKVSDRGLVTIKFTEDIFPADKLRIITNGTIEIDGEMMSVLGITVNSGPDVDPSKLKFWWEAVR